MRLTPEKRIAHALNKLRTGQRLIREAGKELRAVYGARQRGRDARTVAQTTPNPIETADAPQGAEDTHAA